MAFPLHISGIFVTIAPKSNGAPTVRSRPLCSQQVNWRERSHGDETVDWDECLLALR